MNSAARTQLAQDTVRILEEGGYTTGGGRRVDIREPLAACVAATRLFQPAELQRLHAAALAAPSGTCATRIEVLNETTLQGIAALEAEGAGAIFALNFASARNPGGGFLHGTQAQEESLARSSGLYASLMSAWSYYEDHRRSGSLLYSDAMILSPACPVFRDDSGALLPQAHQVSFVTSAAPNAGAIAANQPSDAPLIAQALRQRAAYVLALCAASGCRSLVLGAWGCGVFRNDPRLVAAIFTDLLGSPAWNRRFERVRFSVLDTSPGRQTWEAFRPLGAIAT